MTAVFVAILALARATYLLANISSELITGSFIAFAFFATCLSHLTSSNDQVVYVTESKEVLQAKRILEGGVSITSAMKEKVMGVWRQMVADEGKEISGGNG